MYKLAILELLWDWKKKRSHK